MTPHIHEFPQQQQPEQQQQYLQQLPHTHQQQQQPHDSSQHQQYLQHLPHTHNFPGPYPPGSEARARLEHEVAQGWQRIRERGLGAPPLPEGEGQVLPPTWQRQQEQGGGQVLQPSWRKEKEEGEGQLVQPTWRQQAEQAEKGGGVGVEGSGGGSKRALNKTGEMNIVLDYSGLRAALLECRLLLIAVSLLRCMTAFNASQCVHACLDTQATCGPTTHPGCLCEPAQTACTTTLLFAFEFTNTGNQWPYHPSMMPMRTDPDRVHNYLAPGAYTIRLLSQCTPLIFYTYNKDNEVSSFSFKYQFLQGQWGFAQLPCPWRIHHSPAVTVPTPLIFYTYNKDNEVSALSTIK